MFKWLSNKEYALRLTLWALCEVFMIFSIIHFINTKEWLEVFLSVLVMFGLLPLPFLAEMIFKLKINNGFFVFLLMYALGPTLGHSYNLYYIFPWYDVLLHTIGGFVFAAFGAYFASALIKDSKSKNKALLCMLFGVLLSIAIAVLWEFIEFSIDAIFGIDMQQDEWIRSIHSWKLGDAIGKMGGFDNIESVIVNGIELEGYLDIGLIDTITDMFVEVIGSLVFAVYYMIDKNRHPLVYERPDLKAKNNVGEDSTTVASDLSPENVVDNIETKAQDAAADATASPEAENDINA